MLLSESLDECANIISKPGAWTQFTYARDKSGQPTGINAPDATCWCTVGIICNTFGAKSWREVAIKAINIAEPSIKEYYNESISAWNDAEVRKQQEVVDMFRKAAKIAREIYDPTS